MSQIRMMGFMGAHNDNGNLHHDASRGVTGETLAKSHLTPRLINVANIVDPAVSNNPVLSAAIQVLDQISEVGKVVPFVSPAFVILKIIIDLERRAVDVDIKCNDLLERITFLLSHLPMLKKVEITPATRTVVGRINDALKDAAALIAAYRRQGPVARRLRLSNRDKFTACADALSNCSGDLLTSLQIHQTIKLDVLTRGVPLDAEDTAAETFVLSHGGSVDAVVYDRVLVREFAQERKLSMDDTVMEQLNTNLTETIQQTHARLEGFLRDNVSTSITEGLKTLALEKLIAESEQKFTCVQCDKEFTEHSNGPKACSFHRSNSQDRRSSVFECCGTTSPCQFGSHRIKHHSDYPYGAFFASRFSYRSYGLAGRFLKWANVEDRDLENDETEKASVGQLLSWTNEGPNVNENIMFINIGHLWYDGAYYVDTFTAQELQTLNRSIRLSRRTLIFRTSPDPNKYAMGEWVLSDSGDICGVRVSAKTSTSAEPYVRVCYIDLATSTQSAPTVTLSEGGLRTYRPASPYILPHAVRIGPEFTPGASRPVRTDFKTVTTSSFAVILKTMSDPPLTANPMACPCDGDGDYFRGSISVFNKNDEISRKSVGIASVKALYRLVGDGDYIPLEKIKFVNEAGGLLPFTLFPSQARQIDFEIKVPRTQQDAKLDIHWRQGAYVARHRPLRLKIIIEDFEGEQASLVLEYVFQLESLGVFEKKDYYGELATFFFDNPTTMERHYIHVLDDSIHKSMTILDSFSKDIRYQALQKLVYKAIKSGQSELDLGIGRVCSSGVWEWAAYALIDLSCQRVYAIKFIMHDGNKVPKKQFGSINYVLCPPCVEESEEMRPVRYATETAALPPLDPYEQPAYVQDDVFDDAKPHIAAVGPTETSTAASGPTGEFYADLSGRLASMDTSLAALNPSLASIDANITLLNANLARIAVAFESLAANVSLLASKRM
ncbi:hypothetical protein HYPSUDRAFT_219231 [Hypholoma sublateritium FD-334 SS-4]|uniref:Uncharacterized protein n=1 Tax=Hypholoma sublateritium (strain FD-334 SS-4) TaxID=945553 RepID=A0A0D2NJS5_HYPSF|nr:hypothetical protein HYPSUDRAFT_219231 [Hypholoma sublateritium FD-334 SS-4]